MAVTVSAMELAILIRASSQGFEAFKKAEGGFNKIKAALKAMSAELTALAASRAFAFIGTQVGKAAGILESFSREMALIKVVSGASAEEMKEVEEVVRGLGKSTMFTATESANAFKMLLKAGLSIDQAKEAIEGVLAAATVSGEQFGQIADDLTDIMKQFRLEASRMDDIADVILVGSNKATTSMGQLAEGLSVVGATANELGTTLPSTVADLALLAEVGLKGSEGGTKLRQVLLSLLGPSGKASETIRDLGIKIFDAHGQFLGLTGILKQFTEKGILETDEAMASLIELVGKRQVGALIALMRSEKESIDLTEALTEAFNNQASEAKDGSEIVAASYFGVATAFRSLVEDIQYGLGKQLEPVFRTLIDLFRENENEIRSTVTVIAEFGVVVGTIVLPPLYLLIKTLLNIGQFIDEHRKTVKFATAAVLSWAFSVMLFNIQAMIAAKGGLIAMITGAYRATVAFFTTKFAVDSLNISLMTLLTLAGGVGLALGAVFLLSRGIEKFTAQPPEMEEPVGRQAGTSLRGIRRSGLHFLHKGEVISNPMLEGQRSRITNTDNRRSVNVTVNMQVQELDMNQVVDQVNRARMRLEIG